MWGEGHLRRRMKKIYLDGMNSFVLVFVFKTLLVAHTAIEVMPLFQQYRNQALANIAIGAGDK